MLTKDDICFQWKKRRTREYDHLGNLGHENYQALTKFGKK